LFIQKYFWKIEQLHPQKEISPNPYQLQSQMKDTNTSLLDAVLTHKSRVGNFSAQEYEKATGKAWNFTYDDMEIQFFGENEFKSITYKNKFIEDDYFTFSILYIFLKEDQDALLDLYLILKEMENYQDKLQTTPFCEERGFKKLCSKSEKGMQSLTSKSTLLLDAWKNNQCQSSLISAFFILL
jgi:hypothetical protein